MKPWFYKRKKLALFWSKTAKIAQNQCFLLIFKVTHQIFLIFLMKPWLYKRKQMAFSLFCRKVEIGPFLVKNGQNLFICLYAIKFASVRSCVRPSVCVFVHFRSQNPFIGLFYFLAQSCGIINLVFAIPGQKLSKIAHFAPKNGHFGQFLQIRL